MRPTYYLSLCNSLPLPSGTPITLLPHGVPAYYLSTYAGPVSALTTQFEDALVGFGAGDWKATLPQRHTSYSTPNEEASPTYIIAWLAVQNKQGEDKGIPVIWPVRLCVAFHPTSPSPHARTPLQHIPDLPTQLQASPPPPAPMIPAILAASSGVTHSRAGTPLSHAQSSPEPDRLVGGIVSRSRTLLSSPTSEALRVFRTLTLSKPYARDMQKISTEVSGYVESVAKERERERERIKRERESRDITARGRTSSTSGYAPSLDLPPQQSTSSAPIEKTEEVAAPAVLPEPDLVMDLQLSAPSPGNVSSTDSLFSPPDVSMDLPQTDDTFNAATETRSLPEASTSSAILGSSSVLPDSNSGGMSSFDHLSFDTPWEVTNDFMGMNMDYDMGFGINSDPLGSGRIGGGSGGGAFDMDDGFVFTDDDFNFFDGPTSHSRATAPPPFVTSLINPGANLAYPSTSSLNLPSAGEAIHVSGPGPPTEPPGQSSPWIPQPLGDAFEHRDTYENVPGDGMVPPELLPPTPSRTPASSSAPATPTVQLSDPLDPLGDRKSYRPHLGGIGVFEPIPFAASHRVADGKYVVGKFAPSSPPDDEDRTEPMLFESSSRMLGWKSRYSAATDPRVGLVRKLIGVKRKSFDQGMRAARMSPAWVREHEEWESNPPSPPADEIKSPVDSDDDDPWADDDDTAAVSRCSTPAPSYLPMGPTLLQTQFHHAILLPLSTPLRPPGSAVHQLSGTALTSVPTPVSPAAVLGAASEKAKSMESAASMLFKEVVENSVWASTWRAYSAAPSLALPPTEIWQTDAKEVAVAMASIEMVRTPANLQTLYAPGMSHVFVC